jgi:MraZ protein
MFLTAEYEPVIDDKRRLAIPFPVRRQLVEQVTGHDFYALPGPEVGTLALYPNLIFDKMQSDLPDLDDVSEATADYLRFLWSQATLCESDKQGRICLPEHLMNRAGLTGDVTLVGSRDHLVLWSREAYQRSVAEQYANVKVRQEAAKAELRAIRERKRLEGSTAARDAGASGA